MAIEDNPQIPFKGAVLIRLRNGKTVPVPTTAIKMEDGLAVDLTRRSVMIELVGVTGVELIPDE